MILMIFFTNKKIKIMKALMFIVFRILNKKISIIKVLLKIIKLKMDMVKNFVCKINKYIIDAEMY